VLVLVLVLVLLQVSRCRISHPCQRLAGGALPAMQAYASGATCHTSCAVERMLRTTSDATARNELRRLAERLVVMGGRKRLGVKAAAAEASKAAALQHELSMRLQEGDPLCSELLVNLIEQPFGEASAAAAADWALTLSPRAPLLSARSRSSART
jgi:hypothetical protein